MVIDAAISDGAFRLYSLPLRYGNGAGSRMPSRQTLARRLRRSVNAIDRAMRQLTEAGRWWDTLTFRVDQVMDAHELAEMETRLAETDGLRPALQAKARAELTAEGMPVIRSTVAHRACAILDLHQLQ